VEADMEEILLFQKQLEHYIWVNVRRVQESGQKNADPGHLREKGKMLSRVSIYMRTEYRYRSCYGFLG
jgi:hypothetical protein